MNAGAVIVVPFVRTRVNWLSYLLLSCFGFALSLPGPIMPFLATKLGLTFAEIGYHFTVMSIGLVCINLIGDHVAERVGNDRQVWFATVLIGIAMMGVTYGGTLTITLFSMFVLGLALGALFIVTNTAIGIAAGQHAGRAYTEANIVAGIAGIMGPLLAGLIAQSWLGWQFVAFLPLFFAGFLRLSFRDVLLPVSPNTVKNSPESLQAAAPLPVVFWLFGFLLLLIVGIENLIGAMGPTYFSTTVGLDMSTAASVMSVFAIAVVLGRIIGLRLLESMSELRVLFLSLLWVLLTFPIYWLSSIPLLNIAGLFLLGLGVGNLGPMCISSAMRAAGGASNRASARIGLLPPMAFFTLLQFFSYLSDQIGMQAAYTLMVAIVIVGIALIIAASREHVATT